MGVESIPLMMRSHSGVDLLCQAESGERDWVGVKGSLVLLEIWENSEEGREAAVLGRVYENHGQAPPLTASALPLASPLSLRKLKEVS